MENVTALDEMESREENAAAEVSEQEATLRKTAREVLRKIQAGEVGAAARRAASANKVADLTEEVVAQVMSLFPAKAPEEEEAHFPPDIDEDAALVIGRTQIRTLMTDRR